MLDTGGWERLHVTWVSGVGEIVMHTAQADRSRRFQATGLLVLALV